MKKYIADKELEDILLLNGFIETSSKADILKGKKRFKMTKSSSKGIYFDYINIIVLYRSTSYESYLSLSGEQLRLLLLYFKISSTDYQELSTVKGFKVNEVAKRILILKDEIEQLTKLDLKKSRVNKLQRILDLYEGIKIN